jgi:putative hydrolase of the HAD superfamily
LHCLTNTNEIHLSHLLRRFPFLGRFTKIFASHELQKRKPYPGTYVEVARSLDLYPEEMVFFDDLAANVEGAERAGMEAHLFRAVPEMLDALKAAAGLDDKEKEGKGS